MTAPTGKKAPTSLSQLFTLLGAASLLPWNCLLSTMSYMDLEAFPNEDWTTQLSPLYNTLNCATLVCLLALGRFCPLKSPSQLLLACSAGCLATTGLLCCLRDFLGDKTLRCFLAQVCCGVLAVSSGTINSSGGVLCGQLLTTHGSLIGDFSTGMAVAGVLGSVVSIPLAFMVSPSVACHALFVVLSLVFALSILGVRSSLHAGDLPAAALPEAAFSSHTVELSFTSSVRSCTSIPASQPGQFARDADRQRGCSWLSQVFNLFSIYFQTFLVFPAVTSKWIMQERWTSDSWHVLEREYGLIMVSNFQILDLVGRMVGDLPALQKHWPGSARLWTLILPRMSVVLLCFLGWWSQESLFGSPALHLFSMSALALSNGLLTNIAFSRGMLDASPTDRDSIGKVMPLALAIGIVCGGAASSAIVSVLSKTSTTVAPSASAANVTGLSLDVF